ncbi:MAG: hypothetical protein IJT24_02710 [Lachnospiraceae bacterium]|nr:hypothetical protein [Lachnospiraceae bacterium]
MKGRLGDFAIVGGIILIIGVLIFMKRESIMEALHIESKGKDTTESSEDEGDYGDEDTDTDTAAEDTEDTGPVARDGGTPAAQETEQQAPDVGEGLSVKNNMKVSDPLLEANNVKEPDGTAVVPEAGLIENNIIGSSWSDIKTNYSYTDFEAEPEDIAQLRFLDDGNLKYYQSPASGEIFGVQDDTIVAYLKRWDGTPLNEAIAVEGLFDVAPYIYQCTDHLNMYEWKIANCYVGLLVQDTGDGVAENAPLYAESYVLQRRINTFYK